MKTLFFPAFLLSAGLVMAQQARPVAARTQVPQQTQAQHQGTVVTRVAMLAVEKATDARLSLDPTDLMGNTRGIYLPGYGVVLTSEVALVKLAGPSPFHLNITQDERAKARARKLEALPKLKELIKAAMMSAAADLRNLPPNEKLVFGVNLFYWNWEDTTGLPAQIVMQATRQQLIARLESIQVQEF